MEGHCSTGQNTQWAVVAMEEEDVVMYTLLYITVSMYVYIIVIYTVLSYVNVYYCIYVVIYITIFSAIDVCLQFK